MTLDTIGECAISENEESQAFFKVIVSIFVVYIGLDVVIALLTIFMKLKETYPTSNRSNASDTQHPPNTSTPQIHFLLTK